MHTVTSSYIGIDQSLRSTGIAALHDNYPNCDLIQPPDSCRAEYRLAYIRDGIDAFIDAHGPCTHACIEGPALGATNRGDDLGQLRGVILLYLLDKGIPRTVIQPTTLKKFGARRGDASKEKMIKTAEAEFDILLGTQDDMADALWLARIAQALNENTRLTRPQLEVVYGIRNPKTKKRTVRTPQTLDI